MIITDEMRRQWAEQEAKWEKESKKVADAMATVVSVRAIAALIAEYWANEEMSMSERFIRIWDLERAARKLDPSLTDEDLYELARAFSKVGYQCPA